MQWINPREQLPIDGQIIWCLRIENKEGDRCGLPSAYTYIAEASIDSYGVISAKEICHKGYANYYRHFFSWWHFDQSDKIESDQIYVSFDYGRNSEDMITAWAPYECLPNWDYVGIEESMKIIKKKDSYKKGVEQALTKHALDKIRRDRGFIPLSEHKPYEDGVYVVANKNGVWISKYESDKCNPWIAPNGEEVEAWYPVPSRY